MFFQKWMAFLCVFPRDRRPWKLHRDGHRYMTKLRNNFLKEAGIVAWVGQKQNQRFLTATHRPRPSNLLCRCVYLDHTVFLFQTFKLVAKLQKLGIFTSVSLDMWLFLKNWNTLAMLGSIFLQWSWELFPSWGKMGQEVHPCTTPRSLVSCSHLSHLHDP